MESKAWHLVPWPDITADHVKDFFFSKERFLLSKWSENMQITSIKAQSFQLFMKGGHLQWNPSYSE